MSNKLMGKHTASNHFGNLNTSREDRRWNFEDVETSINECLCCGKEFAVIEGVVCENGEEIASFLAKPCFESLDDLVIELYVELVKVPPQQKNSAYFEVRPRDGKYTFSVCDENDPELRGHFLTRREARRSPLYPRLKEMARFIGEHEPTIRSFLSFETVY